MSGPHPAVAETRAAVRRWLAVHAPGTPVVVACSGGADSLALTAAAAHEASEVRVVVIDHQLQPGSAQTATHAARQAEALGCRAQVVPVDVLGAGGPEAAARRARYHALRAHGAPILLGHTRDDQAESVLLGLGRGSGPRSIAGMRAWDDPWGRPLLGVARSVTHAACDALDLAPHHDPHNDDPRFTRVRLRQEVLPMLEEILAGGVAAALARTATQLREDGDALDQWALELGERCTQGAALDVEALKVAPAAVRRRVLRHWLLAHRATALTDQQLRWTDELVGAWRGQGGVAIGGQLVVLRRHGRLSVEAQQAATTRSSRGV